MQQRRITDLFAPREREPPPPPHYEPGSVDFPDAELALAIELSIREAAEREAALQQPRRTAGEASSALRCQQTPLGRGAGRSAASARGVRQSEAPSLVGRGADHRLLRRAGPEDDDDDDDDDDDFEPHPVFRPRSRLSVGGTAAKSPRAPRSAKRHGVATQPAARASVSPPLISQRPLAARTTPAAARAASPLLADHRDTRRRQSIGLEFDATQASLVDLGAGDGHAETPRKVQLVVIDDSDSDATAIVGARSPPLCPKNSRAAPASDAQPSGRSKAAATKRAGPHQMDPYDLGVMLFGEDDNAHSTKEIRGRPVLVRGDNNGRRDHEFDSALSGVPLFEMPGLSLSRREGARSRLQTLLGYGDTPDTAHVISRGLRSASLETPTHGHPKPAACANADALSSLLSSNVRKGAGNEHLEPGVHVGSQAHTDSQASIVDLAEFARQRDKVTHRIDWATEMQPTGTDLFEVDDPLADRRTAASSRTGTGQAVLNASGMPEASAPPFQTHENELQSETRRTIQQSSTRKSDSLLGAKEASACEKPERSGFGATRQSSWPFKSSADRESSASGRTSSQELTMSARASRMVIPRLTPTDGIEDSNQSERAGSRRAQIGDAVSSSRPRSRRLVAIDSDEDNDLTGRHAAFDAHDRKGRGAGIFVNDFGSVTPRKRGNDEIESSDGSSDAAPFDGFVDIQKLKQTGQPLGSLARYLDQFSADAKHKRRQASTKGGHAARQSRASTTGGGARAIQVDDDNDDDGIVADLPVVGRRSRSLEIRSRNVAAPASTGRGRGGGRGSGRGRAKWQYRRRWAKKRK